ncbi:hypothetical protein Acid345_4565 [Candidatus Koribacter versatilis Ellin345]|uniref:Lipoprotein n=1 Tax=Koribacter versatilis (strain Ellin345) TaxID=204669 RepID=Q1IHT5_KORVE|nr:hypothetical protein [Candidatus Koribacter versatilis]ABF43565.1 hypothetical protein Acid345_4565 [Candidatus Koribacter versatilis Ellin345]
MKRILLVVSIALLLMFAGCKISERGEDGKDKKVDIKTPFGSLKVDEDVNPKDTGLPLYANSKRYQSGNDSHGANVNISSGLFGVKVVAVEFTTPDAPDKVRAYYEDALKTYGKVVVCQGTYNNNVNVDRKPDDADRPVDCSEGHSDNSDGVQLKVGTKARQHVVAVKPDGSGTRFALVYVNARGKESGS